MEVDLPAVGGGEEAEALVLEDANHLTLRRQDRGLHFATPALGEVLDLPLGGIEGVTDGGEDLLRLFVRHQLGAGDGDVDPYTERASLVMVIARRPLDGDTTARDAAVEAFQLLGAFP